MVVEVRSNLIAAHQNVQQTKDYLKTKFQYFNDEDMKVIECACFLLFLCNHTITFTDPELRTIAIQQFITFS